MRSLAAHEKSLPREASGREGRFADPERADIAGQSPAERQRCRQAAGGGARLDAIAALTHQPEEALDGRVVADHQVLVGHEAAQPGPFVLDPTYLQCGGRLDALGGD